MEKSSGSQWKLDFNQRNQFPTEKVQLEAFSLYFVQV